MPSLTNFLQPPLQGMLLKPAGSYLPMPMADRLHEASHKTLSMRLIHTCHKNLSVDLLQAVAPDTVPPSPMACPLLVASPGGRPANAC